MSIVALVLAVALGGASPTILLFIPLLLWRQGWPTPPKGAWGLGLLLSGGLALCAWAYAVGTWQLQPPESFFQDTAQWSTNLLRGGLCQGLALVFLFWSAWQGRCLTPWLVCAGWLGWAEAGRGFWLVSSPQEAQIQLLLVLLLGTCIRRAEHSWSLLVPLVLVFVTGMRSPHWGAVAGLSLFLSPGLRKWEMAVAAIVGLAWVSQAAWPGTTVEGSGLLLFALLSTFSRARPYLAMQLAFWVLGESAQYPLYAALGASLGPVLERGLDARGERAASPGWFFSWRGLALVTGLFSTVYLLKPGEEWFNRRLLIGAQKSGTSPVALLRPHPLEWWMLNLGGHIPPSRTKRKDNGDSIKVKLKLPATMPSRSLVKIEAELTSSSPQTIDLGLYRGLRLRDPLTVEPPVQPLSGQVGPHQKVVCLLFLSTPEQEGDCRAEVELVGYDDQVVPLSSFVYRTWRRLPPVGF